jgi:hypothetical protein
MIKHFLLSIIAFSLLAISSCSKKDDNPVKETSTAKAQFDNSNYGIYKGVFVGSSGVIIININNDNTISATLTVDGVINHFTTTQTVQQNQSTTIDFTNGDDSFTFSVDANGANPSIANVIINGHPKAAMIVLKETSTAMVKCYEGTFTGSDGGTFNVVTSSNLILGLALSHTYQLTYRITGTVSNNQINASGSSSSGAGFSGSISGDNVSGDWDNSITNDSGTWSGKRTL